MTYLKGLFNITDDEGNYYINFIKHFKLLNDICLSKTYAYIVFEIVASEDHLMMMSLCQSYLEKFTVQQKDFHHHFISIFSPSNS